MLMFEEINDLDFKNPSVDLPLKDDINLFELGIGQTFTSFDVLGQCLKRYHATQMGFETKIVRVEKEDDKIKIFIDKFVEEHNHTLNSQELLHQFAPSLLQVCQLGTTILKRILRKKFPDQEIYHQDLYNMIHKFKTDAQIKNDAVILYEHLMKLQQEDSDWYFNVDFEGIKVEKEEQAVTECGICKSWYHDPKLSFKEQ
ncbi:hypothetical protein RhiirC2_768662 [Rhizophagus irregularis]|uniref:Uncharacterized protein n=1 Tax=Rhizophagus irregularis TaxID=588596 RepID=A0A2N1P188_9GLOM|nr:hypothetical protein RhiirC2_768662 [Rhizophagus irregularis]